MKDMDKQLLTSIKSQDELEATVLENASKWQVSKSPLASLNDFQLDIIYQLGDIIKSKYYIDDTQVSKKFIGMRKLKCIYRTLYIVAGKCRDRK